MATVTAPVRTGASAGAQATQGTQQGSSDATPGTGFGDLLAALVPGATSTTPATAPSGVCGAGPEVSVSPDDAVVGAVDSAMVVVGAIGDDTTGSRTGDPGTGTAAETTDGTDATASEPTADPVPGVDAALLAQAQLAALPLLSAASVPTIVTTTTSDTTDQAVAPAGDTPAQPAGLAATPDGVGAVGSAADDASGTPGDTGSDQPSGQGGIALSDAGWQPVAASSTGTEATAAAAVDAAAAAAPATATTATAPRSEARAADAVPGQVFPEVVRLSQSGNGTHRMTLRLDPGTLGEVKITLTVRDGEVQVRLAAQHDAREVLAQSAPDLRRLLEQSGGVDARVAIADLSSGTTTDLSGGAWDRERGTGTGTGTGAETGEQGQRPGSYDAPGGSASGSVRDADPTTGPERTRDVRPRPGLDLAL